MAQSKRYMILVALAVALSGFVWGFDATVISGAVPFIQKYFNLSGDRGDFLLGLAVSCLGWGVLGGTAVAGFFSDRCLPELSSQLNSQSKRRCCWYKRADVGTL